MEYLHKSPFEYASPEAMAATDVIDLFVPVFGEYYNIPSPGHTFIHGPRGSGKSMMFRYMSPECQTLVNKCIIDELKYFAVHIPIKEGRIKKEDIRVLDGKHGEFRLNEHYMVVNVMYKLFEQLENTTFNNTAKTNSELKELEGVFLEIISLARWKEPIDFSGVNTTKDFFGLLKNVMNKINMDFTFEVLSKLSENPIEFSYKGALCLFNEFLLYFTQVSHPINTNISEC